jgi:hypothetical protein
MKEISPHDHTFQQFSRRRFLGAPGTASAGLLLAPHMKSSGLFAGDLFSRSSYLAQVALTRATTYDRTTIKERVQHLFESIDGIGDVVKPGDKVAIKLNLTGGGGGSMAYNMWTHPEVLRAVGELIIDSGVSANDIYIVEALWNSTCYNNYGYSDVKRAWVRN